MSEAVNGGGPPGSHLPNWQPGDDDAEELMLQKIADALRNGESERHIAKLLNVPRTMLWRGKKLAAIPKGLYERLAEARIGIKARIYIGRFCETGELPDVEVEFCPHCGHQLRVRSYKDISHTIDILDKWTEDGRPGPNDAAVRGEVAAAAASPAAAKESAR